MNAYTRLCSAVLFPLHERLKGHQSATMLTRLEASQWWSTDELESYRVSRLRAFLEAVGSRVPYYRDLFRRTDFQPSDVRSVSDLSGIPTLARADIRRNVDAFKADGHGPLSRYNTGGSSGEPLIFFIGKERKSHDVAAKWRATRWWGVDIGDREVVVWGSPIELGAQDRLRLLRDKVFRSRLLPAFEMSPANLDRFVETIRAARPTMLFGYPSSLSLIAAHARKHGAALDNLGTRVAFVTAETLYDDQRKLIGEAFGCPVANGYGARDAGFIAHECPRGNLHISAEDVIVEVVGSNDLPLPPGEVGEIAVTHMATREFPFVRYRTGDVGVLSAERCTCGRALPILADVQGRTTDFVVARDGTVMHGLALIYTLRDLPGIERFKIVQHSLDYTEVQVVEDERHQRDHEARIVHDFKARLGEDVHISVRRVAEIPLDASGKFRYVTSKVSSGAPNEPVARADSEVGHERAMSGVPDDLA